MRRNPEPNGRSRIAATLLALCLSHVALAQNDDLDNLLNLLEEETELATQTKQNADYVPGMVTVLQADEMRLIGARTALDAIALVPGMDIQRNQYGAATIRVRSVDFFFNAGNVKVLVDGLPISREAAFQSSAILLMPIEQLERIEVIRGPGSGVHGDFAYMGLINLVTKHSSNRIGASAGSGDRSNLWAAFSSENTERGFRISGNVSNWDSSRYDTTSGLDNDERRTYLNLHAELRDWAFSLAGIDRDFSGLVPNTSRAGQPPPMEPYRLNLQSERSYNAELRREWHGDGENRSALWFQHQGAQYEREFASFKGPRNEIGGQLVRRWGQHLALAQLQLAWLGIDDGIVDVPNTPLLLAHETRRLTSLTLQDQFQPREDIQITAGLRWDDLDGIDSAVTPRIAALWQINDRHLLKAQYARGFRSPTYQESYSGTMQVGEIPFERVSSREISYIYRTPHLAFRATGFAQLIDHMIFPQGSPAAARMPEIRGQGVEYELTWQANAWLRTLASWSTANAMDGRAAYVPVPGQPPVSFGAPSVGQPEALGNLAIIVGEGHAWSGGVHWQHVGRRADRGIEAFQGGYDSLNLNVSYRPTALPRLRVDFGIRNLLEDDINYLETGLTGLTTLHYDKRLWSVGLSWNFGDR